MEEIEETGSKGSYMFGGKRERNIVVVMGDGKREREGEERKSMMDVDNK